jgi:hypothetical protein
MGLPLLGELAEAVVGILDLVDDAAAARRVVTGEQIGPVAGVIRRFDAADRAIDCRAASGGSQKPLRKPPFPLNYFASEPKAGVKKPRDQLRNALLRTKSYSLS